MFGDLFYRHVSLRFSTSVYNILWITNLSESLDIQFIPNYPNQGCASYAKFLRDGEPISVKACLPELGERFVGLMNGSFCEICSLDV